MIIKSFLKLTNFKLEDFFEIQEGPTSESLPETAENFDEKAFKKYSNSPQAWKEDV